MERKQQELKFLCNFSETNRYKYINQKFNNMALVVISEAWGIKANVSFNEYNHKTKKRNQVERVVTDAHKSLIMRAIDSTDCGEFLNERVGDVELSGYFSLVQD